MANERAVADLEEENRVLGEVVKSLRRQLQLRETEEALLTTHRELVEVKHHAQVLATERQQPERQQRETRSLMLEAAAVQQSLVAELRLLESDRSTVHLLRRVAQLQDTAAEAVFGMQEAQGECDWLHGQLQLLLRHASATPSVEGPSMQGVASASASQRKILSAHVLSPSRTGSNSRS